jgi:hypothetical protein
MTTALLWSLAVLGAWNGLNLIARLIFREPWTRYLWSVIFGAWAAWALWLR